MPITIGSNIASLRTQRSLNQTTKELASVYERLSSGMRINRASDDAAGLAIVSDLSARRRVFTQGIRNLNDGVSLLNVADGAIQQLGEIVIRLKELATQSANGTYGVTQRKAVDSEAQELSKEYFRIARSTTFNDRGIFYAEFGELRLQSGYGTEGGIQSGLGGAIGTGSFGGTTSFAAESDTQSSAVKLGDLNGDGIIDLVTAGGVSAGQVTVRLGTGNGAFGGATSYAMESTTSTALALGDLNGDGVLDLVTAGSGGGGRATVRLGAGNGTFGAATSYAMETTSSNEVALGDLNGDGILDLVTAGNSAGGGATVRLGNGDGTFGVGTSYITESSNSQGVTLGDLNNDGIIDLVTAGASGRATIRLGLGNGTFGASTSYTMGTSTNRAVTLGDLNGDGLQDIVTSSNAGPAGLTAVRLGNGDGTFGASATYVMGIFLARDVTIGDLNGDGINDIVAAAYNSAEIRFGAGDGTFGGGFSHASYSMDSAPNAITLGDTNGDGVLDIVTAGSATSAGWATMRLGVATSGVSPLLPFQLTSRAGALQALSQFDLALNRLTAQRGVIGAFQSRVMVATSVLQASNENYAIAESRILDADIADETSRLVRTQILQQAASAVLAQANQQPSLALLLLS